MVLLLDCAVSGILDYSEREGGWSEGGGCGGCGAWGLISYEGEDPRKQIRLS